MAEEASAGGWSTIESDEVRLHYHFMRRENVLTERQYRVSSHH